MSDGKRLSAEELADIRANPLHIHLYDAWLLVNTFSALEADNAALLKVADAGWNHRPDCVCLECRDAAIILVTKPHPGAALLEEHRKALASARNEALEEAAAVAKKARAHGCNPYSNCTCGWAARLDGLEDDILAMKTPEGT